MQPPLPARPGVARPRAGTGETVRRGRLPRITERTPIQREELATRPIATLPARARAPRQRGSAREGELSGALPWLIARDTGLSTAAARPVVLHGVAEPPGAGGHSALALLVRAAARSPCVWLDLSSATDAPAAAALDAQIRDIAAQGAYTILHAGGFAGRGPTVLAARYADEPAVLFSLPNGAPLDAELSAIRAVHPRALVLIPARAPEANRPGGLPGTVLRWDVGADGGPQSLGSLRGQPLIIAGWRPARGSPIANERLMHLCARGGIGWIALDDAPWVETRRGVPHWSRASLGVLRALAISDGFAPGIAA